MAQRQSHNPLFLPGLRSIGVFTVALLTLNRLWSKACYLSRRLNSNFDVEKDAEEHYYFALSLSSLGRLRQLPPEMVSHSYPCRALESSLFFVLPIYTTLLVEVFKVEEIFRVVVKVLRVAENVFIVLVEAFGVVLDVFGVLELLFFDEVAVDELLEDISTLMSPRWMML